MIAHLTTLEAPDFKSGKWSGLPNELPGLSYSDEVAKLVDDLYASGIVYNFNWGRWQNTAERLFQDPFELERADLSMLRKLLTTHVRKDRFSEGHLAEMLESGHIAAILRRAALLLQQEVGE